MIYIYILLKCYCVTDDSYQFMYIYIYVAIYWLYATLIPSNTYYRYKDFQIIQISKIDKKPLSLTFMSIQKLVSFTRHKLFLVSFTVGIMKTKLITYRCKLFINTQPYRYKRLYQKALSI